MIFILRLSVFVLALAMLPFSPARAQSDQQTLVDRATLVLQEIVGTGGAETEARRHLRQARAALICPRIFRAGFIIGGSGGGCVLLARDARGNWSYPAFYGMGSGSVGFQIGIQDSAILMLIRSERGLDAVMDSQFKIGGDANISVATMGAGVEGATTADLGADIVAFSLGRGLFAGISLQGSMLSSRTEWNAAYYGRDMAARQVVVDMAGRNQGAEPLREVLSRLGSGGAIAPAAPAIGNAPPAADRGVQAQPLTPPRR